MKNHLKFLLSILAMPYLISSAVTEDASSPENQAESAVKASGRLKGFHSFAFFSRNDAQNTAEKTNAIALKEFKKFGIVKNIEIGETIPYEVFEGFASGAFLALNIQDLDSIDNKKMPITQCGLTLTTYVDIEKTKQKCPVCIWNRECYLDGTSIYLTEEKITESIQFLLKEFMEEYSFFNPNQKPIFHFYNSHP